jgi:hypothetical protein
MAAEVFHLLELTGVSHSAAFDLFDDEIAGGSAGLAGQEKFESAFLLLLVLEKGERLATRLLQRARHSAAPETAGEQTVVVGSSLDLSDLAEGILVSEH